MQDQDTGAYLGKYQLQGILGRGGMGVVYKGFDPFIERTVAIKTLRLGVHEPDEEQELLARFKREAQAIGRLSHPNIVQVFEYGEHDGKPYIAMEFVEGRELADVLDECGMLEHERAVRIMEQMLEALAYCHAHGVVHRDLKPANLLVIEDGTVKLTDFGIARVESSTLTRIGAVMGTPNYMSPEQLTGQTVDARSDLFSAAVILYELITGEKPFPGKTFPAIMNRVLRAEFERPSTVNLHLSESWDMLLARALAKRPDERFQSAQAFLEALHQADRNAYSDDFGSDEHEDATFIAASEGPTVLRPRGPAARRPSAPTAKQVALSDAETIATPRPSAPPPAPTPAPTPAPRRRTGLIASAIVVVLLLLGGAGAWKAGLLQQWIPATQQAAPRTAAPAPGAPAAAGEQGGSGAQTSASRRSNSSGQASAGVASGTGGKAGAKGRSGTTEASRSPAPNEAATHEASLDVKTRPRPGAYYGLVDTTSTPAGATVLFDEVSFGKTPLKLEVPPGSYHLKVRKDGYQPVETRLTVNPSTETTVRVQMVKQ